MVRQRVGVFDAGGRPRALRGRAAAGAGAPLTARARFVDRTTGGSMEAMDPSAGATTSWRSYRCPVCSHTDGVLLAGADEVLIRCSHCDTPLESSVRGGG